MINIQNTSEIKNTLNVLLSDSQAFFGIMTPQHMVEHLVWSLRISNGTAVSEQMFRQEKADKMKASLIYTDAEMPIGFRSPVLEENVLPVLKFSSLEESKEKLLKHLDFFHAYFKQNPDAAPVNPSLGVLNHKEWIVFHSKHFLHHFKQFGLV